MLRPGIKSFRQVPCTFTSVGSGKIVTKLFVKFAHPHELEAYRLKKNSEHHDTAKRVLVEPEQDFTGTTKPTEFNTAIQRDIHQIDETMHFFLLEWTGQTFAVLHGLQEIRGLQ